MYAVADYIIALNSRNRATSSEIITRRKPVCEGRRGRCIQVNDDVRLSLRCSYGDQEAAVSPIFGFKRRRSTTLTKEVGAFDGGGLPVISELNSQI